MLIKVYKGILTYFQHLLSTQGQVEQWIDFTTQEIDAPMLSWFLPIIGFMEYNKKVLWLYLLSFLTGNNAYGLSVHSRRLPSVLTACVHQLTFGHPSAEGGSCH